MDIFDLLFCEVDEFWEVGVYVNVYKAYEWVYFYYELVCDYYYMVYVKIWVSEMFYNVFYVYEVSDVVVFKVYSIIEEYLVLVRDMFLFYLFILMNMSFYYSY